MLKTACISPLTSDISTPLEIDVGTHFHERHDTKTTPIFLVSFHLLKSVSTGLIIKLDSVLTNPIGKDGVQDWLI